MEASNLPPDIIFNQILSRLPVKILKRFSCVCKSWQNIISSDETFIRSHLQNQSPHNDFVLFTGPACYRCSCVPKVLRGEAEKLASVDHTSILHSQSFLLASGMFFLGSFDGVVCIYRNCNVCPGDARIYLWNPALRQCAMLPRNLDGGDCIFGLGFGMDEVSKDLRVVKRYSNPQVYSGGNRFIYKYDIYSLRNHSWKTVGSHVSRMPPRRNSFIDPSSIQGMVLDGFFYFIDGDTKQGNIKLLRIDMTLEDVEPKVRFRSIVLPDHVPIVGPDYYLNVFRDCLCLFGYGITQSGQNRPFELWGMMYSGGVDSEICWVKQFLPNDVPHHFIRTTGGGKILCWLLVGPVPSGTDFSDRRYWAFTDLVIYDPDTQMVEQVLDRAIHTYKQGNCWPNLLDNYVESLVSVIPPAERLLHPRKTAKGFLPNLFRCFVRRDDLLL